VLDAHGRAALRMIEETRLRDSATFAEHARRASRGGRVRASAAAARRGGQRARGRTWEGVGRALRRREGGLAARFPC
jgi:hypothetical protein